MIRELTISEVQDVSGGNVSAVRAINAASVAVGSVACPVAMATKNLVAAGVCGVAVVVNAAAYAYIGGATA